jgi:hypothetical protein
MATKRSNEKTDGKQPKIVYGMVKRGDKTFWTRIGAAWVNKDGSLNVKLDFFPASPDTVLNIRDPKDDDQDDRE